MKAISFLLVMMATLTSHVLTLEWDSVSPASSITRPDAIHSNDFHGKCPSGCNCYVVAGGDKWASCESNKYSKSRTQVPSQEELPDPLYGLDLTYNNITHLSVNSTIIGLKWLKITGNSMVSIDPKTFFHLDSLLYLDVSYNKLTQLDVKLFNSLVHMTHLDLSYNDLEFLPKDLFIGNFNLENLKLSYNPLKILYPEWFSSLENLKSLSLVDNQLTQISAESFNPLRRLEEIDLSENLFLHVPYEGLRVASKLKSLKFNKNRIATLDDQSFMFMSNLEKLEVCESELLVRIEHKAFTPLIKLKSLVISSNHDLMFISTSAFAGLSGMGVNMTLEVIDLSRNSLQYLSQNSLPWNQLKSLDLRQNPWFCDCDLKWVKHCPAVIGSAKCAYPMDLLGNEISHFSDSQFVCPSGHSAPTYNPRDATKVRGVVFIMGGILLLVLGVTIVVIMKKGTLDSESRKRGSGSIYYVKAPEMSEGNHKVPVDSLI